MSRKQREAIEKRRRIVANAAMGFMVGSFGVMTIGLYTLTLI